MTGLLLALALDLGMLQEAIEVFTPALEVFMKAGERSRAYEEFQSEMGRSDSHMSVSPSVETIEILGNRFYFDAEGDLWYDDRFVRPDEHAVMEAVSDFFRRHFMGDDSSPLKLKRPSKGKKPLPVFRGYEDPRYQEHDDMIVRHVADFNARRGEWAGATPAQAKGIHDLSPVVVKSQMIEESGGWDRRSAAAWKVDPLQVNVPGDWSDSKTLVGLAEPERRNEGTCDQNVKAAIMFLARKGFGASGQPASRRPKGTFDGWHMALERYNGRNDETEEGRLYRDAYANRILRRAAQPKSFVPIAIALKKKEAK